MNSILQVSQNICSRLNPFDFLNCEDLNLYHLSALGAIALVGTAFTAGFVVGRNYSHLNKETPKSAPVAVEAEQVNDLLKKRIVFWPGIAFGEFGNPELVEGIAEKLKNHPQLPNISVELRPVGTVNKDDDAVSPCLYLLVRAVGARCDVLWEDSAKLFLQSAKGNCVWMMAANKIDYDDMAKSIKKTGLPSSGIQYCLNKKSQMRIIYQYTMDQKFKNQVDQTEIDRVADEIVAIAKRLWSN